MSLLDRFVGSSYVICWLYPFGQSLSNDWPVDASIKFNDPSTTHFTRLVYNPFHTWSSMNSSCNAQNDEGTLDEP